VIKGVDGEALVVSLAPTNRPRDGRTPGPLDWQGTNDVAIWISTDHTPGRRAARRGVRRADRGARRAPSDGD